jgi:hypothetical protein
MYPNPTRKLDPWIQLIQAHALIAARCAETVPCARRAGFGQLRADRDPGHCVQCSVRMFGYVIKPSHNITLDSSRATSRFSGAAQIEPPRLDRSVQT